MFPLIRNGNIYRSALWILGEYSDTTKSIETVLNLVKNSIGDVPILKSEQQLDRDDLNDQGTEVRIEQKEVGKVNLI